MSLGAFDAAGPLGGTLVPGRSGSLVPFSVRGRVWLQGRTNAACCWRTEWAVPASILPGSYRIQTVQFPRPELELTSNEVVLVVQ